MRTIVEKIKESKEIIEEAISKYPKIATAISWGKDSMVMLDLVRDVKPDVKIFSIMTRFKPKETWEYMEHIKNLWGIKVEVFKNDIEIDSMLYKTDPDKCCDLLKVRPTFDALEKLELDAWITGLRRDEGRTRLNFQPFEDYHKIKGRPVKKINPILEWTETDIWKYFAMQEIPVHPWYAQGYRSLGCEPCTVKVDDADEERAGRWAGTKKCAGECGLHSLHLKSK